MIETITGEKLRRGRKKLRWNGKKVSQKAMGAKIGFSKTTISNLECDKQGGESKWIYAHFLGLL